MGRRAEFQYFGPSGYYTDLGLCRVGCVLIKSLLAFRFWKQECFLLLQKPPYVQAFLVLQPLSSHSETEPLLTKCFSSFRLILRVEDLAPNHLGRFQEKSLCPVDYLTEYLLMGP